MFKQGDLVSVVYTSVVGTVTAVHRSSVTVEWPTGTISSEKPWRLRLIKAENMPVIGHNRKIGDALFDEETVLMKDESSGGEKGQKRARFDLLPPEPLAELAAMYGEGAKKYESRNWERGYDFSLSFAALQRHAWRWMSGEDFDPETGIHHMAAVSFHAFALQTFQARGVGTDDRPTQRN